MAERGERAGRAARARRALEHRVALVRMLGHASPRLVAAAVAAALAAGLLPVAIIVASGALSGRIDDAVRRGGPDVSLRPVYEAFVLVMGLFLAAEIMVPVQNRLRWLVTKRVDGAARRRVMEAALAGTDMTRMHGDAYLEAMGRARGLMRWDATPGAGAAGMIGLARDYLTGLAAAVVLATFQPLIAVAALAAALVVRVRWRRANIGIVNVWIDGWRHRREAWYFSELGLGRPAANEVRLFGLRDWMAQRIHRAGIEAWTPTWRQRRVGMGVTTAVDFLLTGTVAVVGLVWAGRAAADGRLDVGGLVVVVPALFAVLALGRYFNDDMPVEYGTVTLPAIETLERLAAETLAGERGSRQRPGGGAPAVALRGVSFRYPGAEAEVLRDVDLVMPPGTSTALVGMNGAGKTTLARLLCGLYPPDRGAVLVDGVDLRELDLHAWHRLIAPMFQEFLRLPSTVAENASIGAVERLDDAEGARRALLEAGAMRFAGRLPQEIDTLLATGFADGTDISGGQWQRLGLARALFALEHGARFLVLDEPTSNLDTSSEERLIRRLLDDTRGVATTLLVTHRLALARRCEQIVVVDAGRVVEAGDHRTLLALAGRYAAAFEMQASLYPLEASGDA